MPYKLSLDVHYQFRTMSERERLATLELKLDEMRKRHREIDDVLNGVEGSRPMDQFTLQRLKKQKLALKDEIARLLDNMHPDIIA